VVSQARHDDQNGRAYVQRASFGPSNSEFASQSNGQANVLPGENISACLELISYANVE
jgi:hypothetical protein